MTIAVDMGRKATKTNKQNQQMTKVATSKERVKISFDELRTFMITTVHGNG